MENRNFSEVIEVLRDYTNKEELINWLKKKMDLRLPKQSTYENILTTIQNSDKEKEFCTKSFRCSSFNQVIEKYDMVNAMDGFSKNQLILIADELSNNKKKWKYDKKTIRGITGPMLGNVIKEDFQRAFPKLILEHKIPRLVQHHKWITGPLGITKAKIERRDSDADDLIELLSDHITKKTFPYLRQLAAFLPREIQLDITDELFLSKLNQLIISYGEDKQILQILNQLIEKGIIIILKEKKYWNFVATPCGIFAESLYDQVEMLTDIQLENIPNDDLDNELKREGFRSGPLRERLYGKCIKTPPDSILDKQFGISHLKRIGRKFGLVNLNKISNKDELIRYLLIRIGFTLPLKIEGVVDYISILKSYKTQVEKAMKDDVIAGIMNNVYVASEKILKDLIYFHISCFWPEINEQDDRDGMIVLARKKIIEAFDERDFTGPSFGQLVYVMKKMNKFVSENNKNKRTVRKLFGRTHFFTPKVVERLIIINKNRAQFTHDSKPSQQIEILLRPMAIIDELINIAEKFHIKKIYPIAFRVTREITNEYNISYSEAVDEDKQTWIIQIKDGLEPGEIGMMYAKTEGIAIEPPLIIKFW